MGKKHHGDDLPWFLLWSEAAFCFLFTSELVIRLYVYRCKFFYGPAIAWNIFDFTVVSLQIFDQVMQAVAHLESNTNISSLRLLRILRLIRIARVIRVVRLVEELHTIVS